MTRLPTAERPALPTVPALGTLGSLPRRTRRIRAAIVVALVLLAVAALAATRLLAHGSGSDLAAQVPGAVKIAPSFYRGPEPGDGDLSTLHDLADVRAVIRIGGPDIAERAATQGLGQAYLQLPVPPGQAPTLAQLSTAAGFLHEHLSQGVVYLHGGGADDSDAVVTCVLLDLLRGQSLAQVWNALPAAETKRLSSDQVSAVHELAAALSGAQPPGHSGYASAQRIAW